MTRAFNSYETPPFSLRHLQANLPWTIPYSDEFEDSAKRNSRRRIGHDVLHVMKSLGRIAAEVERCDHFSNKNPLCGAAFAKEVADLVICALHVARLEGFDLQDAVVTNSEARNAESIPMEQSPPEKSDEDCPLCGVSPETAKHCPPEVKCPARPLISDEQERHVWDMAIKAAIDECWRLDQKGKDDHRNSWMGNAASAITKLYAPDLTKDSEY